MRYVLVVLLTVLATGAPVPAIAAPEITGTCTGIAEADAVYKIVLDEQTDSYSGNGQIYVLANTDGKISGMSVKEYIRQFLPHTRIICVQPSPPTYYYRPQIIIYYTK